MMTLVLKSLCTNTNPFEALIKQEQQLHVNSIYQHLLDKRIKVNSDVKNTVKELASIMDKCTIKSEGRFAHSGLTLNAKTLYFIPSKSSLVNLLIMH